MKLDWMQLNFERMTDMDTLNQSLVVMPKECDYTTTSNDKLFFERISNSERRNPSTHNETDTRCRFLPLSIAKYILKPVFAMEADSRWLNEITCSVTRELLLKLDAIKSKNLIHLGRLSINITIGEVSTYCLIRFHGERIGYHSNDFWRSLLHITSFTVQPWHVCESFHQLSRWASLL